MHKETLVRPLGAVLQQAGLVSAAQVDLALEEQQSVSQHCLGKLLSDHGWIKESTAHFFAEEWPSLGIEAVPLPLGHYFLHAHLLSVIQIDYILEQQSDTKLRFGVLAVANGWIKLQTLNFFLKHLQRWDSPQPLPLQAKKNISIDIPDHWHQLREYLLENALANPYLLLQTYRQILTQDEATYTETSEQIALLNMGLVVLNQNKLVIAHPLYKSVFNQAWVNRELSVIHPYDKIRLQFLNLSKTGQHPYRILDAILAWTNGQSLLNQKIAHIIRAGPYIKAGEEPIVVEQLVKSNIIDNWQTGVASKHLHTLEEQLLKSKICKPIDLFTYYQVVWHQYQMSASESLEEIELIRLGLLIKEERQVKVANLIYRSVFDRLWLDAKFSQLLVDSTGQSTAIDLRTIVSQTHDSVSQTHNPDQEIQQPRVSLEEQKGWLRWGVISISLAFLGIASFWLMLSGPQYKNETISQKKTHLSAKKEPKTDFPQNSQKISARIDKTLPESSSSQQKYQPTPQTDSDTVQAASSENVVFIAPETKLPVFGIGTSEQKILTTLGPPDSESPGYWPNSYGFLYKNIYLHQTDFGYLFDVDTQQLRQTEVAFAQDVGLETMKKTVDRMLQGNMPVEVEKQLSSIFQRHTQDYEFRVDGLKGIIQRNQKDRIYIGIWEADFH